MSEETPKRILFQSKSAPEFRFLSNFHLAPMTLGDYTYHSVEHYYQCTKACNTDDFRHIYASKTPGEARRRGQTIKLPESWEQLKLFNMKTGLQLKFTQNEDLGKMLLATDGWELVEFAPWGDTYWGVDKNLNGQNWLGKLLMEVREELKNAAGL